MTKQVEFYFDVISPASYLAWTQMRTLADETGATVAWKPILLGGVFKATGNASPITVPAKGKWLFADLHRWARAQGVEFKMNDEFPINSLPIMRGLIAYRDDERFGALVAGFFDAMWVSNKNLTEPEVIGRVVAEAGIDPAEFAEKIQDPAVKQALIDATDEAVKRGAFGVPTFFIGDNMHWGQDRLEFVREDLAG